MNNFGAYSYWAGLELNNLHNNPPELENLDASAKFRYPMLFNGNLGKNEVNNEVKSDEMVESKHNINNKVEKSRPFSCDLCGKSFLLKHHLTSHTRTHTGIKPHKCEQCGKSFTHKHCLNTHMLLHSSERPYECKECKKSFTLKHHLISHGRVHKRAKPFVCIECGQSFPLKRHLITHGKFHAGERPFLCTECGESFAQKDHLVIHSRFHGFKNSYACPDCGATFTRKFELVNHGKIHGKQPLSCHICHKEFLQNRTLIAHIKLHTHTNLNLTLLNTIKTEKTPNPKKYHCDYCSKYFNAKHGLIQHQKKNPEGACALKTHTCEICSKSFYQKNHLLLHCRQHNSSQKETF
ncbi:unnamed protein product [Brassicogethes aeneus]|uniref:C2H2-type domain-containing protein n=1 Tax=Brassicogethes aeneus TaxID=1431903 RepID=A0A9P0FQH6_BRAAE|nr:unnamed protein product [Brassicogethes aeneus]